MANNDKYKIKVHLFTLWCFKRHRCGERSVSLGIASLDLEIVHHVGMQTLYSGVHLVADDTLDQPIAIPLCVVGGINDKVS